MMLKCCFRQCCRCEEVVGPFDFELLYRFSRCSNIVAFVFQFDVRIERFLNRITLKYSKRVNNKHRYNKYKLFIIVVKLQNVLMKRTS